MKAMNIWKTVLVIMSIMATIDITMNDSYGVILWMVSLLIPGYIMANHYEKQNSKPE